MCYEVKTDPDIVKVAEKYIKGVTSDSLHNLTTTTQFRYGDINISITNH